VPARCRPNLPGVAGPRLVHDADFKMASPACGPFQGHGEDAPDRPATMEAGPARAGRSSAARGAGRQPNSRLGPGSSQSKCSSWERTHSAAAGRATLPMSVL
jgi:hypothetical protein